VNAKGGVIFMSETQICIRCGRELPATTDYFFQLKIGKIRTRCKECFGHEFTHKLEAKEGYRVCKKCGLELPETEEYFILRKDVPNPCYRGICKECKYREHSEHWFDNKEELSVKNKEYYNENRDKILAHQKQDRDNNPEKHTEKNKRNWEKFRGKRIVASKKRYQENKTRYNEVRRQKKDRNREWYNQYYASDHGKAVVLKIVQKRRALKNNLLSTFIEQDWHDVLAYFNNGCAYCGAINIKLQQDHVIPVSKGGYYTCSNIIPACKHCNSAKHSSDFDPWYRAQPFFSEVRLKKILKWTGYKSNSEIQQMSMF
jgi:hypothetical protein